MTSISIVHISDLHISEDLMNNNSNFYLPHRHGHNIQAFLALDDFLKHEEWDVLAISGDVSRIGNSSSFVLASNWLESTLRIGNYNVGLNIKNKEGKHYIVVPGNHDRFDGRITQSSLHNFYSQFGDSMGFISGDKVQRINVNGMYVNFHLFDSSTDDKSFAFGEILESDLVPKRLKKDELNVAVLHHHFVQPPKHVREASAEIKNATQVASFLLNQGFDSIMFGHTHKSYINDISNKVLTSILHDKRKRGKFIKRYFPQWILRRLQNNDLVSYKREKTKDGKYPPLAYYFGYKYLLFKGHKVLSPKSFDNSKKFQNYIDEYSKENHLEYELKELLKQRTLISLAPSACQKEVRWNGFHKIKFSFDENLKVRKEWDRYQLIDGKFQKLNRASYPS